MIKIPPVEEVRAFSLEKLMFDNLCLEDPLVVSGDNWDQSIVVRIKGNHCLSFCTSTYRDVATTLASMTVIGGG